MSSKGSEHKSQKFLNQGQGHANVNDDRKRRKTPRNSAHDIVFHIAGELGRSVRHDLPSGKLRQGGSLSLGAAISTRSQGQGYRDQDDYDRTRKRRTILHLLRSHRSGCDMRHLPYDEAATLRRAFQEPSESYVRDYLPAGVEWRIGSLLDPLDDELWTEALQVEAKRRVLPAEYDARSDRWPVGIPDSLESYWYRDVYNGCFKATLSMRDDMDEA
ncbi:asparagine synthetase [Oleoguttula sp. CCFEE 5521]